PQVMIWINWIKVLERGFTTEADVIVEAACAVGPYLDQLLDADAGAMAAEFSALLLIDPRPADIAHQLEQVFERDERTREWLLAFLDEPGQLPPDLQAVRGGPHGPVAVSASRYRCPVPPEHYVWYRPHVSTPIPDCLVHDCTLVTP